METRDGRIRMGNVPQLGGVRGWQAADVAEAFMVFSDTLDEYRKERGLKAYLSNPMMECTAIMDKLGRFCRNVKHNSRNDPRTDAMAEMEEAAGGMLIYLIMLCLDCGVSIRKGLEGELLKAVAQHSARKPATAARKAPGSR